MEIYLIRHTRPEIEKGICYGQSDISLTQSFEAEWYDIRKQLPQRVDAIFSSPLSRCIQLSLKITDHFGVPIQRDARLMEMDFGEWEMKRWEEIDQHALRNWMNNYTTARCPGGESYMDVVQRLKRFIVERLNAEDKKVVVVTHGGIIKCFDGIVNNHNGMSLKIDYGEIYYYNGFCPEKLRLK